MLGFIPFNPQNYIYSQDAFDEADYYESMTRQAAQEYAIARARVQAIEHQRERESYYAQAAYHGSQSPHAYYPEHVMFPPSMDYPLEQLALGVQLEEVRRRDLLLEREAQRQLTEEAAREEVQREQEQECRRAQEARQMLQQQAFLAFLGMIAQVASQVYTPQPDLTSRQQSIPAPAPEPAAKPVDRKGKGKAIEVPVEVTPASVPVPPQRPQRTLSMKEELEARICNETDPDVQESLVLLYSDLFDTRRPADSQPVAGPSKPRQTRFPVSAEEPAPSASSHPKESKPTSQPASEFLPATEAPVHPHSTSSSLSEITEIEAALRKLEETFEFPEHLDFVNPAASDTVPEPGRLAYTPNNTPIHAYEHALNALLTRLDAVQSNGDLEVRGRRKEVVSEVERALEVVERRVRDATNAAQADNEDDSTVPVSPSPSEYVLPPVSISPSIPDTEVPAGIFPSDSSATDNTHVTAATPESALQDDLTALDTQAPETIARIASSPTDTTIATL